MTLLPPLPPRYLPILIYQVLQSGLPQLQSIINYITAMRHPELMTSECSYFFTHFVGAVRWCLVMLVTVFLLMFVAVFRYRDATLGVLHRVA